jgi:phosphoenolpyruvate synthase/pyruvate phosphate dikinase
MRAVRLVWGSLWLPVPRAYRAHANVPEDDLAMSVVVMCLAEVERAGVVFTIDPASIASNLGSKLSTVWASNSSQEK